ncbi:MAG TPA: tRNA uridine-5-carboxymethylaminomethyl(34) synthesis GTPase MnmE [Pyrinomonadaceae bacterium]|nr:tRNA uridine-5-carboxymethylaminomethyl(34) synthesis GTPase MnmE [Pyrinomonadaceae bacterium]
MDTIVAVSTPPGRSAIAVVRLSGPSCLAMLQKLVRDDLFTPEHHRVTLKQLWDDDQILDEALVTYFRAPHSFTGEDMVEISCHGSPVIVRRLLDLLQFDNARLAGPGEFTLRACHNGKMNLTQAEAIRDLINAQTQAAAVQATRQLQGELTKSLQWTKQELIRVIVILESAVEFVEDDLPAVQIKEILESLRKTSAELTKLCASYQSGHLLRDGLRVTLAGRPNVGKSSLFNKLVRMERAIVTDIAGTTRDSLTESVSLNGVPVSLTDTAGYREAADKIEAIGIHRTRQAIADADLVVVVIDGSTALQSEDFEILQNVRELNSIIAINKSDLPIHPEVTAHFNGAGVVHVSALSDDGISKLTPAILEPFGSLEFSEGGFVITDSRHYDLLRRALESLSLAETSIETDAGEELVLADLHNALRFLGAITGETTSDEILGEIFSTFCIGK